MRKVTIEVYKASELRGVALHKAYHEWLSSHHYPWYSDNEKTLEEFAKIFPIKISNWEYDAHYNHVSFYFDDERILRYDEMEELENLSGLRLAKYIWNNYSQHLFKGKFYSKDKWVDGKYIFKKRYSNIILDNSCVMTGYYMDDDILEPVYKFLKKPDKHTTFGSLMKECLNAWGKACMNDYKDSTSEKYFIEQSDDNGWEYDSIGNYMSI